MLASLRHEVWLAVRTLSRQPGFTLAAVVTLGLGIGSTTAIFSAVEAVLLEPLPYEESDALVFVQNRYLSDGSRGGVSPAELWEYRQSAEAFEGLAAISVRSANLTGPDTPARIEGLAVSPVYFDLLRVPIALGRGLTADEEAPGATPSVVISHRLWQTVLGGEPDALGRSILLDGVGHAIVGVVSAEHRPLAPYLFPGRSVDFWTAVQIDPASFNASSVEIHSFLVVGRLGPRVDLEVAERSLLPAVGRLEARYPGISAAGNRDVAVTSLADRVAGRDVGSTLWVVLAAVGLLLAVACVNVANMLLARSEARVRQASIHAALGAGRLRLAGQALAESVLIGLAGAAFGTMFAASAQGLLVRLAPPSFPRLQEIGLDWGVLGFCLAISLLSGALAGLLPSMRASRVEPFQHLRASGRGGILPGRRTLLRRGLVVGQVAAAVVIASAAGLLARTMLELRSVDPGFEPSRLLGFQVNAPRAQYGDQESIRAFYRSLLDEIEALPGVTSAAASWQTPLQSGMSDWPVRTSAEGAEWVGADPNMVTDSYFETLGIALVEGRLFEPSDLARPEGTVIVSETAARSLFPDGSAVGRLVNVNFDTPVWREIVGVVRDVRGRGLGSEPGPQTYFTLSDLPFAPNPALIVTLRTDAGPEEIGAAVTGIMRSLDPDVPVGPVVSMDEQVGASMASERFLATLLATFAGTALLLGALGVYGLLAYDVSQGRREIGLRMALGARPGAILGAVVGGALVLGAAGTLLGMAGALATGRLLESFLYGVSSTDPATVAAVMLVVLSTALIASVEPARRAAAVDPLTALREG